MRTSKSTVNKSLRKQIDQLFVQTLSDLSSPEEVQIFIDDFLNLSEKEVLTKRLAVSYWLKKKRSYSNIKDNLKVSSATIASVQTMMDKPGFKLALKKAEAEEWANVWAEKIRKVIK
jgi:uncharacterized protein YerC